MTLYARFLAGSVPARRCFPFVRLPENLSAITDKNKIINKRKDALAGAKAENRKMKKTWNIEVDCAVCAGKCESAIANLPGITSCTINFMTQKMTIEAENPDAMLKDALRAAQKVEPDFDLAD